MKKILVLIVALMFVITPSFAANFSPTLLKLTVDPVIQYDFDGSELKIPVQVSGTNAGVVFLVFTKGKANSIADIRNGFLGWHYVNKVDTCVYFSQLKGLGVGKGEIVWNGKDQDGGTVPAGEYTYYMWAFDNLGAKQKVNNFMANAWGWEIGCEVVGIDDKGLPLAHPFVIDGTKIVTASPTMRKWTIGNDPFDETLMETTKVKQETGWKVSGDYVMDPKDYNYFFVNVSSNDAQVAGVSKYKWVPTADAELQTGFGNEGFSDFYSYIKGAYIPGVETDGTYLFTADSNITSSTTPDASFQIYDMDGTMVSEVDLTKWWSSPEDYAAGGQMNGGPNIWSARKGKVFLSGWVCFLQMVDPARYLESGDIDDFVVWTNTNGDYTFDHNFEATAERRWVCMDYAVGVFKEGATEDGNLFFSANAYDGGAVSFGLCAPDGTGLGYYAFAGETAGFKIGLMFLQDKTPFDGLYCDNTQAGGTTYQEGGWKENEYTKGLFFIGHDSIIGTITSAVNVSENSPAVFSVAQNSPNPFNPTTTINFNIAKASNVSVEVYNVAGQKVSTLADGMMDAGHSVVWDATSFSAGVYFYTVKSDGFSKTMKMTLLK